MSRILYLQCNMGAAGDMLCGALYELLDPLQQAQYLKVMNNEHIKVLPQSMQKCGITGTHMSVCINGREETEDAHENEQEHSQEQAHPHDHVHSHQHASLSRVFELIDAYPVSENVKVQAKDVYIRIADGEGHVHGQKVTEIHFHEVGMQDAIADVVGACYLMEQLSADQVIVSEINLGSGQVRCAHGILPVPAPAAAYILLGAPCYESSVKGELCTPTGAALLQHFHTSYGKMPVMITEKIGYGMGKKDFEQANCLRAFWGRTVDENVKN